MFRVKGCELAKAFPLVIKWKVVCRTRNPWKNDVHRAIELRRPCNRTFFHEMGLIPNSTWHAINQSNNKDLFSGYKLVQHNLLYTNYNALLSPHTFNVTSIEQWLWLWGWNCFLSWKSLMFAEINIQRDCHDCHWIIKTCCMLFRNYSKCSGI